MKNLRKGFALFTVCLLVLGMMTASCPAETYYGNAIQTAPAPSMIYPGDSIVLDVGQSGVTIDYGAPEPIDQVDDFGQQIWTNRTGMVYRAYAEAVPAMDEFGQPLADEFGNSIQSVFLRLETVGRIVAVIGGLVAEDADGAYSFPEGVSFPIEEGASGSICAGVYSPDRTITIQSDPVEGKTFQRWSVYTLDGDQLIPVGPERFSESSYGNLSSETLGTEDQPGFESLSLPVGSGSILVFIPVYAAVPQENDVTEELNDPNNPAVLGDPNNPADSGDPNNQTDLGDPNNPAVLGDQNNQTDLGDPNNPVVLGDPNNQIRPDESALQILTSDEYRDEEITVPSNPLTVVNGYSNQENTAAVPAGATVTVTASDPPEGQRFVRWEAGVTEGYAIEGLSEETLSGQTVSFLMPEAAVTMSAVYENMTPVYTITARNASIGLEGVTDNGDGSISASAQMGAVVTLTADRAPEGQRFDHWNLAPEWTITDPGTEDPEIYVTVGESDITAEAVYAPEEPEEPEIPVRMITVVNAAIENVPVAFNEDGSLSASAQQGAVLTLAANQAPEGKQFDHWNLYPEGEVTSSGTNESVIEVTVGESDIVAEACYADIVPEIPVRTITARNASISVGEETDNEVVITDNGDGSSSAVVREGSIATITANPAPEGEQFDHWNLVPEEVLTDSSLEDLVINVAVGESDISAEAIYVPVEPEVPVRTITVVNAAIENVPVVFNEDGSLSADVEQGTVVRLAANPAPDGQKFDCWQLTPEGEVVSSGTTDSVIDITVGETNITAQACYASAEPEIPVRTLRAVNAAIEDIPVIFNEDGSLSTTVEEGTKVLVTANEAPEGQQFDQWVVSSEGDVATSSLEEPKLEVTVSSDDVVVEPSYVEVQEEPVLQNPQITVEQPQDGGSIDLAEQKDVDGTTVQYTYTLTPPSGYQVNSFTATVGDTVLDTSSLSDDRRTLTFTAKKDTEPEMVFVTAELGIGAHTLTVISGSGSGTYQSGEEVPISANAPETGWRFTKWTVTGNGMVADENASQTTFTIADTDATVTANYEQIPYNLTVQSGSGSGTHFNGDQVVITADPPRSGYRFRNWTLTGGNGRITSDTASQTTFIMTTSDAVVTANYELIPYTLSVKNGSGSGTYTKGTTVNITPNFPPSGKEFDRWEKTSGKVKFDNIENYYATITMRANDTIVTALYKNGPDPNNNSITGLENGAEYLKGTTLTFTANGAGMENSNPNPGDYRFRPASYQIGSVGGSWTSAPYTTSMAINAVGDYTLTVTYAKDVYDGSSWNPDGTNVTKSITFHVVNALSVKTGDSSPLIPLAIAGGAALIVIIILIVVLRRRRK